MPSASTDAERLIKGDRGIAEQLARRLLKPNSDNLVERPWGGSRLRAFKGLSGSSVRPVGESFELAADDSDAEARRYPSTVTLADGSTLPLPALLAAHGDVLLGDAFVARYGRRLPLLPKLLDVAELLSVQAHPPGNTEVYVIVAADPGATLRVGFAHAVEAPAFARELAAGREGQQRLLELCSPRLVADALQALLKPWLARRDAAVQELEEVLRASVGSGAAWQSVAECLRALHIIYWRALDALNAIPVCAGDVIYNSNPTRTLGRNGRPPSAEVHALGNPEARAVLALEIRRPGPTLRAWDNVRFPLREIDIDAALAALNLEATRPDEFRVPRRSVRPGVSRSVESEYFRLEHLEPQRETVVEVARTVPHTLHALAGAVNVVNAGGDTIGTLARGESALVPARVGGYRVVVTNEPAQLVKVDLPPYDD